MIVCFCVNITEGQIIKAFLSGTLNDLYEEGMTQHCGSCRYEIEDVLETLNAESKGC